MKRGLKLLIVFALCAAPAPALAQSPHQASSDVSTKPAGAFQDCATCPEMIVLPPGQFAMGANKNDVLPMYPLNMMKTMGVPYQANKPYTTEKVSIASEALPSHLVTIGYRLAIGKFVVTNAQFDAFIADTGYHPAPGCFTYEQNPQIGAVPPGDSLEAVTRWSKAYPEQYAMRPSRSHATPGYPRTPDQPAVCLSRVDAKGYLDWLSKKTGRQYRLASEAEWEYAARAGTQTAYSFGNSPLDLCAHANFADSSSPFTQGLLACSDGVGGTPAPVGRYEPNAFGLYDMHGNVFEMVEDCYHPNYAGAPADGSAWMSDRCKTYVLRGYSFEAPYFNVRSSSRCVGSEEREKSNMTGFRIAVTVP